MACLATAWSVFEIKCGLALTDKSKHNHNHLEKLTNRPRAYKKNFMLNSAEHEIFLLINVKMPTILGILIFTSKKNSILSLSEPEKC